MQTCVGTGKYSEATRHAEVVFEGSICPVCEVIEEKLDAEEKLRDANSKMQELDGVIAGLQRQQVAENVNEL